MVSKLESQLLGGFWLSFRVKSQNSHKDTERCNIWIKSSCTVTMLTFKPIKPHGLLRWQKEYNGHSYIFKKSELFDIRFDMVATC